MPPALDADDMNPAVLAADVNPPVTVVSPKYVDSSLEVILVMEVMVVRGDIGRL